MTPSHVLLVRIGIFLIALIACRSILVDLWNLALVFAIPSRKRVAYTFMATLLLAITFIAAAHSSTNSLHALPFLVLAIIPALSWQALTWWAWCRDSAETRRLALEIAVERADRQGEPPPSIDQRRPWSEYVFDVEIAQRRASYEPPPI